MCCRSSRRHEHHGREDRKSTRLNSSHVSISYAVFCLKKKTQCERWIPAGEFFTGILETALGPEELLLEVAVPQSPARTGYAFAELARRRGAYALVGVAARVTLDRRGRCQAARITLFSVGDGPVLAAAAAAMLDGQEPSPEAMRAAAEAAAQRDIDPPSDIHASAAYRRRLAAVLTRRALQRAVERAGKNLA